MIFLILIVNLTLFAQEKDSLSSVDKIDTVDVIKGFTTKDMRDDKRLDEETKQLIKKGDSYIYFGQRNYNKALEYYIQAFNNNNEDNAALNFIIGECYLKTNNKAHSILYLQKAHNLNSRVDKKINYLLGQSHQSNADFDAAIDEYEKYIKYYKKANRSLLQEEIDQNLIEIYKKIEECKTGIEMTSNPIRVFIDNIGDSINSSFAEYGPFITADATKLFFTSRKAATYGGKTSNIDYQYYEDIYVSNYIEGNWSAPVNLGKPVNSKTNDAVIGISLDGQKLFIYRDANGGDIYLSKLKGDKWSRPSRLNKKFNTNSHESSATFSFDQRSIYFVSDKSDTNGFGGKDIYKCKINSKGKWEEPVNLGPTINTPYDENCVFAHPDGKTIYFSSKGHKTTGGYDIFRSTYDNGEWSEPENIGYPINTVGDDVSFTLSANGKTGYYASSIIGGKGDKDIYVITFLGPEKEGILNTEDNLLAGIIKPVREKVIEPNVKIKTNQLTILKGIITDDFTKEPIEASIEIVDNEKKEVIGIFESNSKTGKYLVSLPSGKNYGIAVRSKGYLFHSETLIIPASSEYQVIYKNIALKKLDVGSKIVLRNIFFDTGKDSLRYESFTELARLYKLLTDFSNLKIEISGHTDNVGSAAYNKPLSEKRARAVVNYLIIEGINIDRLEYIGYGFEQPIVSNDTEDGRQQNRRTEFKILSTNYKSVKSSKEANISKMEEKGSN